MLEATVVDGSKTHEDASLDFAAMVELAFQGASRQIALDLRPKVAALLSLEPFESVCCDAQECPHQGGTFNFASYSIEYTDSCFEPHSGSTSVTSRVERAAPVGLLELDLNALAPFGLCPPVEALHSHRPAPEYQVGPCYDDLVATKEFTNGTQKALTALGKFDEAARDYISKIAAAPFALNEILPATPLQRALQFF